MKKIISILLSVIMLCSMAITAGTAEDAQQNEETYSYTVGVATLDIKTRIEDYIDDDYWGPIFRYSDLARDLGWEVTNPDFEEDPEFFNRIYIDPENHQLGGALTYGTDSAIIDEIDYETMQIDENAENIFKRYYPEPRSTLLRLKMNPYPEDEPGLYRMNEQLGYYVVTLDHIVIMAYIMENARYDLHKDLFEGVFPFYEGYYHLQ